MLLYTCWIGKQWHEPRCIILLVLYGAACCDCWSLEISETPLSVHCHRHHNSSHSIKTWSCHYVMFNWWSIIQTLSRQIVIRLLSNCCLLILNKSISGVKDRVVSESIVGHRCRKQHFVCWLLPLLISDCQRNSASAIPQNSLQGSIGNSLKCLWCNSLPLLADGIN